MLGIPSVVHIFEYYVATVTATYLVFGEVVLRVLDVKLLHDAITGYLRNDAGCGDAVNTGISLQFEHVIMSEVLFTEKTFK